MPKGDLEKLQIFMDELNENGNQKYKDRKFYNKVAETGCDMTKISQPETVYLRSNLKVIPFIEGFCNCTR